MFCEDCGANADLILHLLAAPPHPHPKAGTVFVVLCQEEGRDLSPWRQREDGKRAGSEPEPISACLPPQRKAERSLAILAPVQVQIPGPSGAAGATCWQSPPDCPNPQPHPPRPPEFNPLPLLCLLPPCTSHRHSLCLVPSPKDRPGCPKCLGPQHQEGHGPHLAGGGTP